MSQTPDVSSREACHLQKSYGSRQVVFDVSVKVQKGEVVGLLGPNGAGSTTSFYMIVGLVRNDGGQSLIDGEDVTRDAHSPPGSRMGLSRLPQEASIFSKAHGGRKRARGAGVATQRRRSSPQRSRNQRPASILA
jgi:lipopolysaccharide export system ATP-binding protein